ncbi:unnamed protein product [Prorocentrum cordatum]|uniref:Protein Wnt n=1 Tax=Prorocentrum cordatum TaxID=2364126 RepID=A0ABN9WZX5_9DINO|nr:unnamed protein product [Polarella glacialis]
MAKYAATSPRSSSGRTGISWVVTLAGAWAQKLKSPAASKDAAEQFAISKYFWSCGSRKMRGLQPEVLVLHAESGALRFQLECIQRRRHHWQCNAQLCISTEII